MSEDLSDFFALPPFKADEALVKLRRDLRDLKLLEKPGGAITQLTWKGLSAVELSLADPSSGKAAVQVAVVKRLSQRPEWVKQQLASSAEVRKWLDEFKRGLKRWDDED
jgi:hypothetical protein